MSFDEQGFVWLSDPWIASAAFIVILGLVLWSHGWIAAGAPPRPRSMAVRMPRAQRIAPLTRHSYLRAVPGRTPLTTPPARALRPPARRTLDRKVA